MAARLRANAIAKAHPDTDVRVVDLYPDREDGSDVADWLKANHDLRELRKLVAAAPRCTGKLVAQQQIVKASEIPTASSMSSEDLLNASEEVVDYIIDGIVPSGGVVLVVGHPKTGKTQLAREKALCVARGDPFLGRTTKAGVVLWLALEEHRAQVATTFRTMGLTSEDRIRFYIGSSPAEAIKWIEAEVDAHDVGLIVIDTWHKLTMVDNVNDYATVNRANEPLMRLARERGVAQIWLHHTNKVQGDAGTPGPRLDRALRRLRYASVDQALA